MKNIIMLNLTNERSMVLRRQRGVREGQDIKDDGFNWTRERNNLCIGNSMCKGSMAGGSIIYYKTKGRIM